jgi:hypothetical protein
MERQGESHAFNKYRGGQAIEVRKLQSAHSAIANPLISYMCQYANRKAAISTKTVSKQS